MKISDLELQKFHEEFLYFMKSGVARDAMIKALTEGADSDLECKKLGVLEIMFSE